METHITQLIDFTKVDALLEGFNKSTGFVTAILDLEGNIISKSGWRPICTDFHRIHPDTFANCVLSDTVLANKMTEGEKYHFYKCLNGLVDVVMPIVLNNKHVANLFSGQFFFEKPDMEFFRMQAQKYGFDEEKYLGLLSQVPIVTEEKVKNAMDFLHQMTQLISERSFEKAELSAAKEKLEETSANITAIIEGTFDSVWAFDRDYNILYINDIFQRDFQASFGVLLEKGSNLLTALPEPIRPIYQSRYDRVLNNEHFTIIEEVETAIGNLYIQITFNPILKNNEVIGGSCFGSNITERKETENLITNLSTSFAHLVGKSFFEAICEDAARILKLDYLFVGKLNDLEHSVTVTGGFAKGQPMGELTYQLEGTPCEQVIGKKACTYPSDIQQLFPEDKLLQQMGIHGYIGIPLFSKDEKPVGIMVGLHEAPITNTEKIMQIFSFYVERVSAELQRSISEEALRESESQFRGLFDFAADAIFIADTETGIIIHANEKAGQLIKCPFNELIGKQQRELHPAKKNKYNEDTFKKQIREIEKLSFAIPVENTVVCTDGTEVPVEIIASEVKYHGKKCLMGIFRDITERNKAENQLRKLSQAVEQSPASVVITDLNGNIEYVNPKFLEATGYSFDEVIGRNPRILKSGEQTREYYKNLWDTITSGRIWQGELHNKKKNGDLYWESVQIYSIKNSNGVTINYLAVKEDITDRKAMEIQLNETMEQVQKYAKHLQKVREEEKALLAREIHDELGQLLVALKMDTGVTTTQYNKAVSHEDKEKIKLKLSKHADMITKAISSARRIMYGLRPVKLEMLGFAGACEEYLEDFSSRYEIECVTNIDLDIVKLDEERSLAMYRILQETMMNIVKHAQATEVEIKYYQIENDIVFEVKDNGVGFNVGKDGREDSYGLLGISERVSLLKGTLEIDSSPGNGTRVVVRFPLG